MDATASFGYNSSSYPSFETYIMSNKKVNITDSTATVPLPSADLINYRFDQTDKRFEELSTKLDTFTSGFVTKEDSEAKRREIDRRFQEIEERFALHRWYWRAIFSAVALALFTAVSTLITKR